MKFINKLFSRSQNENARFILLKKALPKEINLKGIEEIRFLSAIEYSEQIYEELKNGIAKNEIADFHKKYKFNSLKDALEIFLIKKKDHTHFILILFSPSEYYQNEYVMDIIEFKSRIDINNFEESEIVFDAR